MLMTRVAFLGTVATALRAGSARRAPFWRRSQTTMSFSIQDTVAASDVVVFEELVPLLPEDEEGAHARGDPVHGRELDERDDGQDIQDALAEMTGQRTVPSVFIKGTHVGGNDDTQRGLRAARPRCSPRPRPRELTPALDAHLREPPRSFASSLSSRFSASLKSARRHAGEDRARPGRSRPPSSPARRPGQVRSQSFSANTRAAARRPTP